VFIGEARQGLPSFIGSGLLRSRARDLRKAGDEYLNVEFGWKPMMRDLRSFGESVKSTNKTLRQLHRDSGRVVRRRYHFPTEKIQDPDFALGGSTPWGGSTAPYKCDGSQLDSWMLGDGPSPTGYKVWKETETKRWFSGAYRYYVPTPPVRGGNLLDKMEVWDAEANKLLGTRLTPEVVWNLAPWSWAYDWFTNTGDVMTNLSAFSNDQLTLQYGYIMSQQTVTHHSSWQGYIVQPGGGLRYVTTEEVFSQTTKVRLRATPFGFGFDFGSLSPKQMAITAAIGISNAPRPKL